MPMLKLVNFKYGLKTEPQNNKCEAKAFVDFELGPKMDFAESNAPFLKKAEQNSLSFYKKLFCKVKINPLVNIWKSKTVEKMWFLLFIVCNCYFMTQ